MDLSLSSIRSHLPFWRPAEKNGRDLTRAESSADNTATKALEEESSQPVFTPGGNIARFALESSELRKSLLAHLTANGKKLPSREKGAAILKADIAKKAEEKARKSNK